VVSPDGTTDAAGTGPLAGVRVVDFGRFVSGSYASMLLAALGADVVKVEAAPRGDPYRTQGTVFTDGESGLFRALNLGKRSICVDLRTTEGRDAVEALLATADVFIENGRPGALASLGLDSESVARRHPRIVYGSISGYGQTGPDAGKGGFDLILQAEGGLMSVTGEPDAGPVKAGVPLLDIGSALSCALAVVAALFARDRTGRGAHATSSLMEFAVASFTSVAPAYFATGESPGRLGSHSPTFAPYGAFRAADGYFVAAGAGSDDLWVRFCAAIDADHLVADDRFASNADRVAHLDQLVEAIEQVTAQGTVDRWLGVLEAAGVPAARVRNLHDVLSSDQVRALSMVQESSAAPTPYRFIGPPMGVDGPLRFPRDAPTLGEHTDEVLDELRVGRPS
jgi:crotonobetainyl-CoA:carnitine CoA-transferase CaiB-like acyl-CoA transferase